MVINHCRQALAKEIKAAGSIQRCPGLLAAKRWQLWAGARQSQCTDCVGGSRVPRRQTAHLDILGSRGLPSPPFQLPQQPEGTLGAHVSVPKLPREVDHGAIHSYGCLWVSWLGVIVREDGTTPGERQSLRGGSISVRVPPWGSDTLKKARGLGPPPLLRLSTSACVISCSVVSNSL